MGAAADRWKVTPLPLPSRCSIVIVIVGYKDLDIVSPQVSASLSERSDVVPIVVVRCQHQKDSSGDYAPCARGAA